MFAKSKQIGLVSLFVVLAAAIGGCAESVSSEPASFPSQERPVAFLVRTTPVSELRGDNSRAVREEALAPAVDARHLAHSVAAPR
jgi:hypothetical protein